MAEWEEFVASFEDKLMQPQIEHSEWVVAHDTPEGDEIYPADLFSAEEVFNIYKDHITREQVELKKGWGAQLSAPGYLDCTGWTLFESEEEAKEYLMEMFGED